MNPNEWIALVDVFDLFKLKEWCTEEELLSIEKVLELEILATLKEKYSPEHPNEAQTLDVIAQVKKDFIIEYITESYQDNPLYEASLRDIKKLLDSEHAHPEKLAILVNTLYLAEN